MLAAEAGKTESRKRTSAHDADVLGVGAADGLGGELAGAADGGGNRVSGDGARIASIGIVCPSRLGLCWWGKPAEPGRPAGVHPVTIDASGAAFRLRGKVPRT